MTDEKLLQVLSYLRGSQNTQLMARGLQKAVLLSEREEFRQMVREKIVSAYEVCRIVYQKSESLDLEGIKKLLDGIEDPSALYFEWGDTKNEVRDLRFSTVHKLILEIEKLIS